MWSKELQCDLKEVQYDAETQTGILRLAEGHCCDMVGAIRLIRRAHPDAQSVHTFSGDQTDTFYRRASDGRWRAFDPSGRGGRLVTPT